MRRAALLLPALLCGCSLAPQYQRPSLPVPAAFPAPAVQAAPLPSLDYRDVYRDARLQSLIDAALANNRDLRVAAANILIARASYRIQRAGELPRIDATAGATYGEAASRGPGTATGGERANLTAQAGVSAFELDLFGRLRSLSAAQLNRYFQSEAAARATRLTLVADIADAWLAYAADRSLLALAEQVRANAARSVELTGARLKGGIAPRSDLRQAETILAGADSDLAQQRTALAQDVNALQLLVGAPVDPALLPASIEEAAPTLAEVPAGLDSTILLRRPDVVEAEFALRAVNAEIGAARAALFPRISLTSLAGVASSALSSLFTGGAFTWQAGGNASYAIFSAGAGRANVRASLAARDAALASYEKSVQAAFRDVSDALARRATIDDQLSAENRRTFAAQDSYRLTEARYRGGVASFLESLDAQRTLYSAQRTLVGTRLTAAGNRVTLYRVLGGDALIDAGGKTPRDLSGKPLRP